MEQSISKTNANNSSWRRKSNSLDLVDRISTLPYSILGNILSFLPTKNAVSTAVLSKRWKLVWTTVHNLDLCYEDSMGKQDERDDMRFVGFVNRVLLDHDAGWLNKFCLVWTPRCISSHASSWISTAISKNIHHLILRLETHTLVVTDFSRQRTSPEPFVMPICVFSCNSLRCLELNGGISISESIVVCLPGLETLRLKSVYLRSQKAFENLIRGCPMLSDLFILMPCDMLPDFIQDVDFTYVISSTSLRRFEFNFEYFNDPDFYINLELDTCSLEYLTLEGFIPVFLGQKRLSSLIEAKLTIDMLECNFSKGDMCNSIVEAVRVFDSAKALILSAGVIWALSFATDSLSTEFKRLVKLETKTYYCYWSSVGDFIRCSDNLEVITMDQQNTSLKNDFDHTSWTPPVEVPRCLSNSLKKIVLRNYCGGEEERELIHYMLNHGSALEVMEISCHRRREKAKSELVKEICELSKKLSSKFPSCEVKFVGAEGTSKCNVKVL